MNFKNISAIRCIVGSVLAMAVIFGLYSTINTSLLSFSFSKTQLLDYIEQLSWRHIYFVFGSSILCLQCIVYKDPKPLIISALVMSIITCLIFTALCVMSNESLIPQQAIIYGGGITVISFIVLLTKKDLTLTLMFSLAVIALTMIGVISSAPVPMGSEINKVAQKYEKEFKDLGYVEVKSNTDITRYDQGYETIYTFKRNTLIQKQSVAWILKADQIHYMRNEYDVLPDYYKVKEFTEKNGILYLNGYEYKDIQSLFDNIQLKNRDGKLYIKGITANSSVIDQTELAKRLDIVMQFVVMPKLRQIKNDKEAREKNQNSYNE